MNPLCFSLPQMFPALKGVEWGKEVHSAGDPQSYLSIDPAVRFQDPKENYQDGPQTEACLQRQCESKETPLERVEGDGHYRELVLWLWNVALTIGLKRKELILCSSHNTFLSIAFVRLCLT